MLNPKRRRMTLQIFNGEKLIDLEILEDPIEFLDSMRGLHDSKNRVTFQLSDIEHLRELMVREKKS